MNGPRTIGRYEIRGELGRGMMGLVYEAHDPALSRDIALKAIHLAGAVADGERQSFEDRFVTEARSAARLTHPGIVVVHDVGRDPETGTLFMALELLRGVTLERVLKERGPMGWREALRIAQRVAEALAHAHSHGVIHRDIKPANVMLLASGEPKIMDFGIAKLDASQLTAAGQFLGTPLYMSPEQALAHPLDARSDLFALGSVLYEMLTGRAAFAGESVTKILYKIISREPEGVALRMPELPAGLEYVLARSLAKELARRYPDASTLAADLEDILSGRLPRGQAGWEPTATVGGTLAGTLPTTSPQSASPTGDRTQAVVRAAAPELASPSRPVTTPRAQTSSSQLRRRLAAGGILTVALVAGAMLWRNATTSPPVARRVDTAAAATAQDSRARDAEAPQRSGVKEETEASTPARLTFSFEHSLKSGALRVWLDDQPIIEEDIGGRVTKEIAGLKRRKGWLSDTFEVAPGRREVRVQVSWDDNVKTESAWANFKAGTILRLKAKLGGLGGLRKDLSLEWS